MPLLYAASFCVESISIESDPIDPQGITPAFLMQRYGMLAKLVKPQPIERTVRDIDDDAVVATALAAKADIIATGDSDLLVLHPYQGIQILNAADALQHALSKTETGNR